MKMGFWGQRIIVVYVLFVSIALHSMEKQQISIHPCYESIFTLQQRCLLVLIKKDIEPESLPGKLKHCTGGFKALKKLHSFPVDAITLDDIKSAFWLCASSCLRDKVLHINEKRTKRLGELTKADQVEAHEVVPKDLNLFDSLTWILNNHCQNNINGGLMQISRYRKCRKRKIHCRLLLSLGAQVNYYGTVNPQIRPNTPLITAAVHKKINIMRLLLANGADPNQPEKYGDTAYTLVKRWQTPNQEILTLLQHYKATEELRCNHIHEPSETCKCCRLQ